MLSRSCERFDHGLPARESRGGRRIVTPFASGPRTFLNPEPDSPRVLPFWAIWPTWLQRAVSVATVALAVWLLSMVSLPPRWGSQGPLVVLGGVLLVVGVIGVLDPDRLTPEDIGEQSD